MCGWQKIAVKSLEERCYEGKVLGGVIEFMALVVCRLHGQVIDCRQITTASQIPLLALY